MGTRKISFAGILDFKELIVLAVSAFFCSLYSQQLNIDTIGVVPSGLPSLHWPVKLSFHWQGTRTQFFDVKDLDLAKQLMSGSVLIAMVVFISSFASAKKCALERGYKVEATSELLALGLANAGGAFVGGTPCQIGLSRSALAMNMGVETPLGANILVALVVAMIVQLFSGLLFFVPRCALNTIIVSAATHLTEFKEATKLWKYRTKTSDVYVWYIAFVGTLLLGAFAGMCVAVFVSLILVIYRVAEPDFSTLGKRSKDNQWMSRNRFPEVSRVKGTLVCRLEGPLFYANGERLQERLEDEQLKYADKDKKEAIKRIIFSASSVSFVDSTGIAVLKEIVESCKVRGVSFYIANAYGGTREYFVQEIVPLLKCKDICQSVHETIKQADALEEESSDEEDRLTAKGSSLLANSKGLSVPAMDQIAMRRRKEFARPRQNLRDLPTFVEDLTRSVPA